MTDTPPQARPRSPRGDTRSEIIDVALTMFSAQGYDKTSLREIADAVGVTKAALYYHFRTKDDIVRAAFEDYITALTTLLDEAAAADPGPERTGELLDGLLHLFSTSGGQALRFGQANPTAMSQLHVGEVHLAQVKRLIAILAEPAGSAESSIRAVLAFASLVLGAIGGEIVIPGSPDERLAGARKVAQDILTPRE